MTALAKCTLYAGKCAVEISGQRAGRAQRLGKRVGVLGIERGRREATSPESERLA
jgi:hypothetical protein